MSRRRAGVPEAHTRMLVSPGTGSPDISGSVFASTKQPVMSPKTAAQRDSMEWASIVRNVCQSAVGDLLDGDRLAIRIASKRLKTELPTPRTVNEALQLRHLLFVLANRGMTIAHARHHALHAPDTCSAAPPKESLTEWIDLGTSIGALLDQCVSRYLTWFDRHHPIETVESLDADIPAARTTEPGTRASTSATILAFRPRRNRRG